MVGCNETDKDYYLGWSVLDYFTQHKNNNILSFYKDYKKLYGDLCIEEINLKTILSELCRRNFLRKTSGTNLEYSTYVGDDSNFKEFSKKDVANFINCFCFGFPYIYESSKCNIRLLSGLNEEDKPETGTAFVCGDCLYTAMHCVTRLHDICIEGFAKEELEKAKVLVSKDDGIDVAIIDLDVSQYRKMYFSDATVLDDILVLGYPKIPGFNNFLTAEKANISAVSKLRFSSSKGQVTAIEKSYLSKCDLMLITAKIRGGNSGGPVINSSGFVVGIVLELPDYTENECDDLGYGICIPYQSIAKGLAEDLFVEYKLKT